MAAHYDITLNRNENFHLYLEYTDGDDLVDFVGLTADNPIYYTKMMIKKYAKDDEAVVLLKSFPYEVLCGTTFPGPSGGIKLNRNSGDTSGQTGGILVNMNSFVTRTLSPGKSFYDLFIIQTPNGASAGLTGSISTKLLEGSIDVIQEVTTNIENNFADFTFSDEIDGGAFP